MSFTVLQAWNGRQFQSKRETGSTACNFGAITADEMEAFFMTLCCVLPYLLDRELRELNTAQLRKNPLQLAVEDPMLAIRNIIIATLIVVCGRLLS